MGYGIYDHVGPLELEKNLLATACKHSERESDRLEMVEDYKEELKLLNRTINNSMKKQYLKYYYLEYVRLGGKSVKKQFKKHLRRFFELTFNIYVYKSGLNIDGTCCDGKYEAWIKWTQYLNNCDEANLYMRAVDNISHYT